MFFAVLECSKQQIGKLTIGRKVKERWFKSLSSPVSSETKFWHTYPLRSSRSCRTASTMSCWNEMNFSVRPATTIERIYFVERGVVSASVMDGDKHVQIGLVGRDGFAGCATVYSPEALSYWQIEVLIRGDAWMIPASDFHECLDKAPVLRKRAVEQAQVFIGQVAQTSLCNNQHRLTQRLARWLLVTRDKARTDDLPLSGDLIASALGPSSDRGASELT